MKAPAARHVTGGLTPAKRACRRGARPREARGGSSYPYPYPHPYKRQKGSPASARAGMRLKAAPFGLSRLR